MLTLLALTLAYSTGTVKLHIVDAHGKPLANRVVWLVPTKATKPIGSFGYHWPQSQPKLTGSTNGKGDVEFRGVRKGQPMMVIVRFGPRFDPFVLKKFREIAPPNVTMVDMTMDVVRFDGAAYVGKSTKVVLADDYQIIGRVIDRETGKQRSKVLVQLSDTGTGHMSGYPGTTIEETLTDAKGNYVFKNLPNLAYEVFIGPSVPFAVESKVDADPWRLIVIVGGKDLWSSTSNWCVLDKPLKRADFRISVPAKVTIKMKGGSAKLEGWVLSVGEGYAGRVLAYPGDYVVAVLPGKLEVWITHDSGKKVHVDWITLRPGESRTLEYTLSEVLARRRKKG
jgi:hypothetical protein